MNMPDNLDGQINRPEWKHSSATHAQLKNQYGGQNLKNCF